MIEVDEGERVRAECIKLFSLPMNERLLLKVRIPAHGAQPPRATPETQGPVAWVSPYPTPLEGARHYAQAPRATPETQGPVAWASRSVSSAAVDWVSRTPFSRPCAALA